MLLIRPSFAALILFLAACQGGSSTDTSTGGSSTGDDSATTAGPTTAPTTTAETSQTTTTDPPTSTADTGESSGDPTGAAADGCDGAKLLAVPEDTSLPGPWPVGARTVSFSGLTIEVWYPATPGSEADLPPIEYDIRSSLPDSEQAKVPDAANPWQPCDCYRDLPLDATHGPYPTVIFVHGTAGFRSQSLEQVTHWASRGFVVLAADHPGLWLHDLLGQLCGITAPPQNLAADISTMVGAIKAPVGELAFLSGRIDPERIAMAGHSAGGGAIEASGGVAQVLIPMAAGGVSAGAALQSTLIMGAQSDQVVSYDSQVSGYADSPPRKRLVGIANAGHLAFSSLCSLQNADDQDFVEIATQYDVCGAQFASALFDCKDTYTPDATNWAITNYATSAVLEETLHCSGAGANFAAIQSKFPEVGEFQEAL